MYNLKVENFNIELTSHERIYLVKLLADQAGGTAKKLLHKLKDAYEDARQVKYLEYVELQKNPKMKRIDELEALLAYYEITGESDESAIKELTSLYDEMNIPDDFRMV